MARSPRKIFASPFVITLAACSAPVQQNPPPQPQVQPQPSTSPHEEVVIANPPHPSPAPSPDPSPAPPPPAPTTTFDQHWTVMKDGATCHAMAKVECPKAVKGRPTPTCNPPPPIKYACPGDWDGKGAYNIVQYAGATECRVEEPPMNCPPKAMCNPPPPRTVACPKL